jgi:hypothetical protein
MVKTNTEIEVVKDYRNNAEAAQDIDAGNPLLRITDHKGQEETRRNLSQSQLDLAVWTMEYTGFTRFPAAFLRAVMIGFFLADNIS